jgi:hypothetical protein
VVILLLLDLNSKRSKYVRSTTSHHLLTTLKLFLTHSSFVFSLALAATVRSNWIFVNGGDDEKSVLITYGQVKSERKKRKFDECEEKSPASVVMP